MDFVTAPAATQKFGVVKFSGIAVPITLLTADALGTPVDADHPLPVAGKREYFSLAVSNVASPGAPFTVFGGDYVFAQTASAYGSIKLQVLGPDGANWQDLVVRTASDTAGGSGVALGSNAIVRVALNGTADAFATLSRVPA